MQKIMKSSEIKKNLVSSVHFSRKKLKLTNAKCNPIEIFMTIVLTTHFDFRI